MSEFSLQELAKIIAERAQSDDENSYTRKLLDKGIEKCAKKFGEEAVELAIAAVARDPVAMRSEAADVLYHLLVLLQAGGVSLAEVIDELAGRTGRSGLAEKASRPPD